MTRRNLLRTIPAVFGSPGMCTLFPDWARSANLTVEKGIRTVSGREFDFVIDRKAVVIDGRQGEAITINGQIPAPLLRWREGDDIVLRVTNRLEEDTSIHWHGILVPFQMDGVPAVSFPGIKPGETFTYRFRVPQSGTYWYHSHSGLQEQLGHYGPIVIEPKEPDPVQYDREYVVMLSDWSFTSPERIFGKLKKMSSNFNFQKRTVADFFRDTARDGLGKTFSDRLRWGCMRMSPTDFLDVTGAEYVYLVNGHAPAENWTALFEPGQRVRLRIINAAAMTFFDVRIPGLPMTVVQADGLNVRPVETDEFQIGVAETYDVIVRPERPEPFTLMCESIDRSGYARATLAPRAGMEGVVPPRRLRPLLTMKDMGMGDMAPGGMSGGGAARMGSGMEGMPNGAKPPATTGNTIEGAADPHAGHSAPQMDMHKGRVEMQKHEHPQGPGVQSVAMNPTRRVDEPGPGLLTVPHRTLTYAQLVSLEPNRDKRPPGREIELHLTSNMERYMWSFDGKKFSDIVEPIAFYKDERIRLTMINDTMMQHPIHLHGMFFDVVNGAGEHKPRKHTIIVKPAEKISVDITADALGDWAFHCHLLYHMVAGMFQIVSVREGKPEVRS